MHETFDHTADLGLRIRSATEELLFVEAAEALLASIVEDPTSVQPTTKVEISLQEDDREYLLFDWLKELLFRFDAEHWLFSRFEVQLNGTGLKATVWGEPLDLDRHELNHEVKAITYHGLKLEQTEDGWLAEVIVDI